MLVCHWCFSDSLGFSRYKALFSNTFEYFFLFSGIGVGDSHASSLSATTNWIVRDGIGKIVSITFAYYKGSQIDADCKRFRLFADVVNDVAMSLNIVSALLPPSVRPYIYCVTSCCWALVGVAGGCSRTAMTIHQARRDNASDVQGTRIFYGFFN